MHYFQLKEGAEVTYTPRHARGDQKHIDSEPGRILRLVEDKLGAFVQYYKKENGLFTTELQETPKFTEAKWLETPGMEDCPDCDGHGEAMFSCCTGNRVDSDYGRCPSCGEGLGEEECQTCDGTGLVKIEDHIEAGLVEDPIGAAEAHYEGER